MRYSIIYVFKDKDGEFAYGESKILYRPNLEIINDILWKYLYMIPETLEKTSLLNFVKEDKYYKYVFESLDLFKDFDNFKDMNLEIFYVKKHPAPLVAPDEITLLDEKTWRLESEL